ncbi:hypothetical protein [Pengzhenrongella sicca]|uniref:Uncharacterized protein n=1 Tax=Pengzhenrongella sicca TaxID=2819238 RepID=A0A8A4ZF89_9MICO|nr:hypothetical protein [Pengzhenrongella sicca]QTE29965.1 hypothetical protein J4E96_02760 [Pengzhenrongella sicca]
MPVLLTIQVAFATAFGGLVAGFAAGFFAISTLDVSAAVTLRAVLVAALILVAPYLLVRRRVLAARRTPLLIAGLVGLAVGYVVNPFAWSGRAFFAQGVVEPGVLSAILDLAGWLVIGAAAVLAASRAAASQDQALSYER